ncbi:hypothetical protein [Micavibrio aeruginosavorus]|uniref:hypothetical protein n=1 Tax=Micavibrio aeruginosavorus TaxID=349221 RepID=UPI0005A009EA|nr:hypothetical protein [Micavibrio aeruginosavorus]
MDLNKKYKLAVAALCVTTPLAALNVPGVPEVVQGGVDEVVRLHIDMKTTSSQRAVLSAGGDLSRASFLGAASGEVAALSTSYKQLFDVADVCYKKSVGYDAALNSGDRAKIDGARKDFYAKCPF